MIKQHTFKSPLGDIEVYKTFEGEELPSGVQEEDRFYCKVPLDETTFCHGCGFTALAAVRSALYIWIDCFINRKLMSEI